MRWRTRALWLGWAVSTAAVVAALGWRLAAQDQDRRVFMPGPATHGHHQIELACQVCHTTPFPNDQALQDACMGCHGAQLAQARDSHPRAKFTDPRNADRVARLDARWCVTCHTEHRPEITHAMGVTLPTDLCVTCHADIGTQRETHAGLGFATCASAGCHNFHDNRALYEDFLTAHAHAPAHHPLPRVAARAVPAGGPPPAPDAPADRLDARAVAEWHASAHGAAGVACSDCHGAAQGTPAWRARPDHDVCAQCHRPQVEGFLAGLHGMRLAQGLDPMRPELARLPMRADAAHRELGCTSCHGAHEFDTRSAAVDACLQCHTDDHSRAYVDSPHHRLWQAERAGQAPAGSGVSCATCHMPRTEVATPTGPGVRVEHNQSLTLRPNEKMARPVCTACHGLAFTLDALADAPLVARNFDRPPAAHVRSVDMALERAAQDARRRPRQ